MASSSQGAGQGMSIRELEDEIDFQAVMLKSLQGAGLENQDDTESQIKQEIRQLKARLREQLRKQGGAGGSSAVASQDRRESSARVGVDGESFDVEYCCLSGRVFVWRRELCSLSGCGEIKRA